ncbi:efflux RND transporter permease subunit [Halalkalibacillus halophilus]|uniref:efflux RND transporter permease subunit n=1 Tax=Halalkalibacillus halophilus TaxID=392827 RepID=UPI0003FE3172|nr:efflux RND transporter permease subunit [Halalkalibacillus halophilus]
MKFLLERSKLIFLFFILLTAVGIYTFTDLPQRDFPETPINNATVTTVYPGASPEEVEANVSTPIENAVGTLDGVESFQSTSTRGFSTVVLSLEDGINQNELINEINQEIASLSSDLPQDASDSEVTKGELTSPIFSYFITADSHDDLNQLQSQMEDWQKEIENVNGVDRLEVNGLEDEELVINLDSELLQAEGILFPDVLDSIEQELSPTPLGEHQAEEGTVTLNMDHFSSVEEVNEIRISGSDNVTLEEIAELELQPNEEPNLITYQGQPAINLTIYLQSGEDIPSMSSLVNEEMDSLEAELPSQFEFQNYFAQSDFISEVFNGLFTSLAIAVVAVVVITTLGLTISGAIVVAIAIPISIILGLIPLPYLGVDINQISVIGAIIALGILVDDSIVLNDNIERRYRLGDSPLTGAAKGIKEVRTSIITSTLAIVFTFSPLIFLSGANGAFIRALPSVLIATLLASTVVALILVPAIRYVIYKRKTKPIKEDPGILGKPLTKSANFYAVRIVKKLIGIPKRTAAIGLSLATLVFVLVIFTPFEFFPAADREEVTIDVSLENGQSKEDTLETMELIAEDFRENEEQIKDISIFTNDSAPNLFTQTQTNNGDHTGRMFVRINQDLTSAENFKENWEEQLRESYSEATIFMNTIEQGPPSGAPLTITVKGEDLDEMLDVRDEAMDELRAAGADLVVDNVGTLTPAISYVPDRDALDEYDLSIQEISEQISLRTTGIPFETIREDQEETEVSIYLDRLEDGNEIDLEEIVVPTNQEEGPPIVTLDEILDEESDEVIPLINHEDGERSITIRSYADDTDAIEDEITSFVDDQNESNDELSLIIGAETDNQDDFFTEITVIFSVVILLVYLLIAFQFNSLAMPFLILVSVYLGIAGAILGLFVTQTPISFLAVTGMVSLTGIVVRNSLVLVDFIEQSIAEGKSQVEAIVESARARFRPILLTAITSITALMPVAIGGDVLFQPLAITIISGILFSTVLTLLLVPVLYVLFKKKAK